MQLYLRATIRRDFSRNFPKGGGEGGKIHVRNTQFMC